MAQELIYTSAPRGLRVGSSGFCTVACTRGMAPNYVELLESLSGYTAPFPPHDRKARLNPTAFSHYRVRIGGKPLSILSRVAFAGLDHTQRSNKLAHHLVLQRTEQASGGPAWMLQQPDATVTQWSGEPHYLEGERRLPAGDSQPAPCTAWQEAVGDAGWAGVLAQAFLDDPREPSFLIFEPGVDMLRLVAEALRLVPPALRWDVAFNTYFTSLPVGTACAWRCCLAKSRPLRQARRMPNALVIDLTTGPDQPDQARRRLAAGSPLIACARDGTPPPVPAAVAPTRGTPALQAAVPAARGERLPTAPPPGRPPPPADRSAPLYGRRPPKGLSMSRTVAVLAVLLVLSLAATGYLLLTRGQPAPEREEPALLAAARPEQPPEPAHFNAAGPADKPAVEPPPPAQDAPPPSDRGAGESSEVEVAGARHEPAPGTGGEAESLPQQPHVPPVPTTEFVSRVAEVTTPENSNLAKKLLTWAQDKPTYDLAVDGISPEWQVREVGYSTGRSSRDSDGQPNVFEMKAKVLGTEDEMMWVARIRPQDGGLLFERNPGAQPNQLENCLAEVAWVKLRHDASRQTVYVLTSGLSGSIQLHREGQGPRARLKGRTGVPELFVQMHKAASLDCVSPITDEGRYRAAVETHLDQHNELVVNISYTDEVSDAMRQIRKQRADAMAALPGAEERVTKAEEARKEASKPIDVAQTACTEAADGLANLPRLIRDLKSAPRGVDRSQREADIRALEEQLKRFEEEYPARQQRLYNANQEHAAAVKQAQQKLKDANEIVESHNRTIAQAKAYEAQEQRNRAAAFGRFSSPLQFTLNDQVVAAFKLEAPAGTDAQRPEARR